jgi:acetolactate synthase-1/2/3 large subunit
MSDITGGELLARCLANEGVRFVFGLPCPEVDPLLASLEGNGLRLVPIRHEAAAVHMAEGLYKTTGEVAAVLGNPGPGSANLLPGVVTARHEGVPVVVITAQHRLGIVYPSPPSTFQGQDQLDVFRPAVKWGGPIFDWSRIPEVTALAFREMWCGRPGPVQLEVPAPVIYAVGDPARVRIVPPTSSRGAPPRASEAQLREAATLLAAAERPLVVAGSGVDRAGANAALGDLVALLGCRWSRRWPDGRCCRSTIRTGCTATGSAPISRAARPTWSACSARGSGTSISPTTSTGAIRRASV